MKIFSWKIIDTHTIIQGILKIVELYQNNFAQKLINFVTLI